MSARARAHAHRVVAQWGCGALTRTLVNRFGGVVQEGPFAGLALTQMTHAEQLGPYLLGVYESELDEAWDTVFRGTYSQIVDIGAKFGYYAVGLARKFPDAAVLAFDTDWWARKAVREMAAANGTRNVVVEGFCSGSWIVNNAHEAALVISDCEGYEAVLFDPMVVSTLRSATLIIETHDCLVPGVSDTLQTLFSQTHDVRMYGHDRPRREHTRSLDFLTDGEKQLATQEVRPPQLWLLCLPKTGPNQALRRDGSAAMDKPSPGGA